MWLGRNSETGVYCKTIGIRPQWGKTWWSQPTRDELPCSSIIPAEDRRSAWATCRHGQMVSVKHKRTRDKPSRSLFSCPVSRPLFFFSYCKKLLHIPRPCMFPLHFHLISFGVQINGCVSETADSWQLFCARKKQSIKPENHTDTVWHIDKPTRYQSCQRHITATFILLSLFSNIHCFNHY